MKTLITAFLLCCCCTTAQAQEHAVDRYLHRAPIATIIASTADGVSDPQDLDFCRVPGREDELWVLNKGNANGGSVVIVYNAGKENQATEYRHDSHAAHFMRNATGIAMAANGNFGTTADILNTVGDNVTTFMGPTLWTSDTSIFARAHQNDWAQGELLGSHSDMQHESPNTMGIAADTGNVYWVFDGYHGYLYRYDFAEPHPYGHDDHSDGIVHEYGVELKRISNLPSHLILEQHGGWLYVVDNGNQRVLRVQTSSGEPGDDLDMINEHLEEYRRVENVQVETVVSGITRMCGIELFDGRLIVSVNNTGEIRIYDVTVPTPTYLGSIYTGEAGIMGVKMGPDSALWYVNRTKDKVVRLIPGEPLSVEGTRGQQVELSLYPNPAHSEIMLDLSHPADEITIVNALGNTVKSVTTSSKSILLDIMDLPNGVYHCLVRSENSQSASRFIISR